MSEWQKIETAPKDGTLVSAAKESSLLTPRFPYPLKQRWNGAKWEADDGRAYEPQPTHWQPIQEQSALMDKALEGKK